MTEQIADRVMFWVGLSLAVLAVVFQWVRKRWTWKCKSTELGCACACANRRALEEKEEEERERAAEHALAESLRQRTHALYGSPPAPPRPGPVLERTLTEIVLETSSSEGCGSSTHSAEDHHSPLREDVEDKV